MDLKVAGTEKGVTAVQMDLKVPSIPIEILKEGLLSARDARLKVLAKMKEVLEKPRPDISPYAPRIINLMINPEKVGDVIGPAGKIIKKIISQTNSKIEIEESGKITIASSDTESAEKAKKMIREITVEAEVGKIYTGKVVRLEEYGAFIEILPNIVGLLHISEIAHRRIKNIRDVIKMGQTARVKVMAIDEDNKIKLSKKALEYNSYRRSDPLAPKPKKPHFHRNRNHKDKF
jgi:polyribonucleotide nucleotidyltransferase